MQQTYIVVGIVVVIAGLAAVGLPLLILFEETQARRAFERQERTWEYGQLEDELATICGYNVDMRCRDRRAKRSRRVKDAQTKRDALRFFSSAGKP